MGSYLQRIRDAWNQFWFSRRESETLAVMRILVGAMLLYTHLVWTFELDTFFGAKGVIPSPYRQSFPSSAGFSWSHFDWMSAPIWLWLTHGFALVTFLAFMLGCLTRVTSILSFLLVVSYANRATGALFGLDQINAFLTLYLAISHCGTRFSVDALLFSGQGRGVQGSGTRGRGANPVANNIATRLIQLHLCIVYLFAATGKLSGVTWWNGEAIWGTLASYEYQTLDMTWLADALWLVNLLTYATIAWELSYPFLIWPKLTRPIFLMLAVIVHLGIGISMGMMTFGLIMIFGNLAFVSPATMGSLLKSLAMRRLAMRCLGMRCLGMRRLGIRPGSQPPESPAP